jgi:membrane-bound ClpP family serine protease
MVIAAGFILLELKTHHGLSATIGVIIFVIGFLLVFALPAPAAPPPSVPASHPAGNFIQVGLLTYVIMGVIAGGGVLGSIYLYRVRETMLHRPPAINPKAIIGKEGTLTSDLSPGQVATANISSEDYTVTGTENLVRGTRVKVKDVQGLKLVVEKATEVT